jgi:hypothetical protein
MVDEFSGAAVEAVAVKIRPLLRGLPAPIQGAVLADLFATWLAGHIGPTPEATWKARDALIEFHIEAVRSLAEIADQCRKERGA